MEASALGSPAALGAPAIRLQRHAGETDDCDEIEKSEAVRTFEDNTTPHDSADVLEETAGEAFVDEDTTDPDLPPEIVYDPRRPQDPPEYLDFLKPCGNRPNQTFAVACGCHCLLFALFLALSAVMGKRFLNQNTKVALHLWENKWKIREHAILEGNKVCGWSVSDGKTQELQGSQPLLPAGAKEYTLSIVYSCPGHNMLTPGKLLRVKELEDHILSHPDYEKFCLRDKEACLIPSTAVMACNPSLCGTVQNRNGLSEPQPGCGPLNASNMTPAGDCNSRKSVPAGFFQCTKPEGCQRSEWTINQTFLKAKALDYSTAVFAVDAPETGVIAALDSQFSAGDIGSSALQSEFRFGFPLEGFSSTGDRPAEQAQLISDFLEKAYFDKLNNYNKNHSETDSNGFLIGFQGGPLADLSIREVLMRDFMKVALAFVLVFLYMLSMTHSVFYSIMALGQIFLCFFTGFLLYRVIFGNFFGSFHIMAIFLLVGIGVDNCFVFNDHFQAALDVDPRFQTDFLARLSWTWKHAARTMGVTTLTTATSFLCNGISAFPGIAAFGIFAGSLIAAMYVSMVFFWPAVVAFNYRHFSGMPFLCGVPSRLERLCPNTSDGRGLETTHSDGQKPALVRFFKNHFSFLILRHRIKIIVLFIAVSAIMFVQVVKLTPEKRMPELLPESHPVRQFGDLMRTKFVRGGSIFNTKVYMVFGFDKEPLDRSGLDTTGQGYGVGPDVIGTLGKVRWNPHMNSRMILQGFPCMVQLCDAAEEPDVSRRTGGLPAYGMQDCFARDIQTFLLTRGLNDTWASIISGNETEFWRVIADMEVLYPSALQEAVIRYAHAEQVGDERIWRFLRMSIKLASDTNLGHQEGTALADRWEEWMDDQMSRGHCALTADTFWGFVYAKDFHQFAVTRTMISEMSTGICVCVTVALIVLVTTTGSIIVGSLAALSIGMIVIWVMAVIPVFGWELGMVENIVLVMVPGLSVDFTAHLAQAYMQSAHSDREKRVVQALELTGVSIVSGAISTFLAGLCLLATEIIFFRKFGILIMCTIISALLFSLFFFPSLLVLIGPQGNWHVCVESVLTRVRGRAGAAADVAAPQSKTVADPTLATAKVSGCADGDGPDDSGDELHV